MAKNSSGRGDADALLAPWRFDKRGSRVDLPSLDPAAKPYTLATKASDQERVEKLSDEQDNLQNLLIA